MKQRNSKKTLAEFINEVQQLVGNEYSILGNYINKDTKITFRHNIDNFIFEMTPHNFLMGSRCPQCAKKLRVLHNRYTIEKFMDLAKRKNKNLSHIEILEYNGQKKKAKIKNNITNEIYYILPKYILDGALKNVYINKETFNQRLKKKNLNLELIGDYTNTKTKTEFKCLVCNYIFNRSPNAVLTACYCPRCQKNKNREMSIEKSKRLFEQNFQSKRVDAAEYNYDLTNYKNNRSKILFTHLKCGKNFLMSAHDFNDNLYNCPYCSQSYQEKRIIKLLTDMNISFESQKKFIECKDKAYLPFDFYIPDYNLLIEYDGEFHYLPIKGNIELKKCQKHDKIKTDFANKKHINLLRISYLEKDNLENIIRTYLTQGSTTILEQQ